MLQRIRQTHCAIAMSALALLVLGFATTAQANRDGEGYGKHHQGRRDHHRGPGEFDARYADQLGLDAEVREKIQQVVADSKERNTVLRKELRAARNHIHELLEVPQPVESEVMANADQIADIEADMHKNRLRALLEIRNLLTPEQRQQLIELRAQRHERRDKWHRRGFGSCRRDLQEHCAGEDGPAAIGCLQERWDMLSPECRDTFDADGPEPAPDAAP